MQLHSPWHDPLYANGIARPVRQDLCLSSHKLLYVLPSAPQIILFCIFSVGQCRAQNTQCGCEFWSSKQCCPTGHWTNWHVAVQNNIYFVKY